MTDWIENVEELLAQNKTTGENHSEFYLNYTKMNLSRMKRWMKTGKLLPEVEELLSSINKPQKWVLITEAWCGDASHAYSFIYKMAEKSPFIELDLKLRDQNIQLMDQYLTNGGRSIPKLIAFDEHGNELFNWGPRPKHIQEFVMASRANGIDYKDYVEEVQKMYNADKGVSTQKEIAGLIQSSSKQLAS